MIETSERNMKSISASQAKRLIANRQSLFAGLVDRKFNPAPKLTGVVCAHVAHVPVQASRRMAPKSGFVSGRCS